MKVPENRSHTKTKPPRNVAKHRSAWHGSHTSQRKRKVKDANRLAWHNWLTEGKYL
jgi:hypothetical protein